jgi:hypothetical protein
VAFKAKTSSTKGKSKAKKEESSDDDQASGGDEEEIPLFVCRFGKFMKKGYGAKKRSDQ